MSSFAGYTDSVRRKRVSVLLRAFFDDSGNQGDPFMAMAAINESLLRELDAHIRRDIRENDGSNAWLPPDGAY